MGWGRSQIWLLRLVTLLTITTADRLPCQATIYELVTPIGGFVLVRPDGTPTDTVAIAPDESHFKIANYHAGDDKSFEVIFTYVPTANPAELQKRLADRSGLRAEDKINRAPQQIVTAGGHRRWRIPKDVLNSNFYVLFSGPDGGVLAVPFKYQAANPRKLTAGGTLGGYVGYHIRSVTPLASAGIAFVSAAPPSLTPGQSSPPDTKVGFTVATGVVVDSLPAVQVGAIVGWDLGIDPSQYPYAGKAWLSLSIGTGFTKH